MYIRVPVSLKQFSLGTTVHCKCTMAKIQNTNIPRNETARVLFPISTLMILWAIIYSHEWSATAIQQNRRAQSWEYINRSQIHECIEIGNEAAQFHFWEYLYRIFGTAYACAGFAQQSDTWCMETVGTDRRKDAFCVELLSRLPFYAVELHVFYLIPKFAAYLAASWIHGALIL